MNKKVLVALLLIVSTIIASFAALNFGVFGQGTTGITVYIDPEFIEVSVCEYFAVHVKISDVPDPGITDYDFFLSYDSSQMTPVNAVDGGFLNPNVEFHWEIVDPDATPIDQVHVWAKSDDGGAVGSGTLATIKFHCDAPGTWMWALEVMLSYYEHYFSPDVVNTGTVLQNTRPPTHTYIDPPTITVPICTPFTVDVMVDNVVDLYGFSLVLTYDTASVDAIDIVDGGFLDSPIELLKNIDDPNGKIEYSLESTVGGVDGSGAIATITFHCTGQGESILNIDSITLWDSNLPPNNIPTTKAGGRVIQIPYWEPVKLIDIVEWPGTVAYVPLIGYVPGTPPGYYEIKTELEGKGFTFVEAEIEAMEVHGKAGGIDPWFEPFSGVVTSWWSHNTLEDGTRACMLSAEMDDETSMAMGFVTNLLPPELIPEVDPYIIVNAQPYLFVRFYWWEWPSDVYTIGRLITWSYWWYDSHSHPNWFWGPYWWWRVYTKAIFRGLIWLAPFPWAFWRPWWGWWWHWVYWRHWYWWSTYFPYDP